MVTFTGIRKAKCRNQTELKEVIKHNFIELF